MGRSRGLEPPTSGTTNRRSNQLSYDRHTPLPDTVETVAKSAQEGPSSRQSRPVKAAVERREPVAQSIAQGKQKLRYRRGGARLFRALAAPTSPAIRFFMEGPGESSIELLRSRDGVRVIPSPKIEMVVKPGFLDPGHCAELIALIDADRRPSTLADYNGDELFRTSETCDLKRDDAAVQRLEDMLAEFTGIDPAHGEQLQGQRYEVGQEFKQHTDWFNPDGPDWNKFCSVAGQRTWTFMIYLNDVEAGGATRFKPVAKTIQPERGKILGWNNRKPDGSGNVNTMHHAMKVRKGVKYVITKWYRERPWG